MTPRINSFHLPALALCACASLCAGFALATGCSHKAGEQAPPQASGSPQTNTTGEAKRVSGSGPATDAQGLREWKDTEAWLRHSPLKEIMRSFWVDCNVIVGWGGYGNSGYREIECSANDIARKADRLIQLWSGLTDALLQTRTAAETESWDDMDWASERLHTACINCHVELWPQAKRDNSVRLIEAWRKGDPFPDAGGQQHMRSDEFAAPFRGAGVPDGAETPSPKAPQDKPELKGPSAPSTPETSPSEKRNSEMPAPEKSTPEKPAAQPQRRISPLHKAMREFIANLRIIHNALRAHNVKDIVAATEAINSQAQSHLSRLREVYRCADALAAAARKGELAPMREAYGTMTANCIACHAMWTPDVAAIPKPLAWDPEAAR